MIAVLTVLLALAFPALAHASVALDSAALALAAGISLIVLLVLPLWRRPMALLAVGGVLALGLAALAQAGQIRLLLTLPPVVLNALIGLQFARSLRAGRMSLIERAVRALNDGAVRHPDIPAYARRLTLAWALLLFGLALLNAVLALLAEPGGWLASFGIHGVWSLPAAWWSWSANVLNYVVIAVFFLAEYAYRVHRFPEHDYGGLIGFLRRMASLGPQFWRGQG